MNRASVSIRTEEPGDAGAIQRVQVAAFASHPHSRQTEHLVVRALREARAMTVSPVAERNEEAIGHIAFSPALIDRRDCGWQILGPVGVLPEHQRQGVGRQLIREGLAANGRLGARGCVLVGEPAYCCRFGFTQAASLSMPGVPAEYLLALSFDGRIPEGTVSAHAAFSAGLRRAAHTGSALPACPPMRMLPRTAALPPRRPAACTVRHGPDRSGRLAPGAPECDTLTSIGEPCRARLASTAGAGPSNTGLRSYRPAGPPCSAEVQRWMRRALAKRHSANPPWLLCSPNAPQAGSAARQRPGGGLFAWERCGAP